MVPTKLLTVESLPARSGADRTYVKGAPLDLSCSPPATERCRRGCEVGLGAAGVAIDPAPRGVFPEPKAVRSGFHVLRSWRGWNRVLRISFEHLRHGFVHGLPEAEQREAYERHVVPTPGRPFFQAAFGKENRVDLRNGDRAPLLITAGGIDRTVTSGMNRANYKKYERNEAITDFKEFPGRTHWVIAEPGWQEVADHAIGWAEGTRGSDRALDQRGHRLAPLGHLTGHPQ